MLKNFTTIKCTDKASTIPKEPGVYVFIGADNTVLYAGCSKNLRSRFSSHGMRFNSNAIKFAFKPTDLGMIVLEEQKLLDCYGPMCNRKSVATHSEVRTRVHKRATDPPPAVMAKVRAKLRTAGFRSVAFDPGPTGRASRLRVDGVTVEVKSASRSATGKRLWKFNLHRRGVLDESTVNAYIFHLAAAPDFLDFYLVFPAPIGKSTIAFSPSTVARVYSSHIDNWAMLKKLARKVKRAA